MIRYIGREPVPGWAKAVAVGVVSAGIVAIGFGSYVKWTNFMEDCMADRPRYECEVLWASTHDYRNDPHVVIYNKD